MRKKIISLLGIALLLFFTPIYVLAQTSDAAVSTLTEQEKVYFKQIKSLRVLTAPNVQPYAYESMGVSIDILESFCESADIELEVIEAKSYEDALVRLANGEAELAAVKITSNEDSGNILPYLSVPIQMVYHKQSHPLEQSSVSMVKMQGIDFAKEEKYFNVNAMPLASVRECLETVRSRQADMFLCDNYQLSIYSERFAAWDLNVVTLPHSVGMVGFGLRENTDVRLSSALQREVEAFSTSEMGISLMRHLEYYGSGFSLTQFVYQNPFAILCALASLFFVVLLCIFVFVRVRSSQHQELKGYEESYRMLADTFGEVGLEYDFLSDRFTFFGGRRGHIDLPEIVEHAHLALKQGTLRLSLTSEDLDKLLQNNAPNQSYQVELKCGMKEGNWNWFRMIYIVVCTSESHRRPIRLIGCLVNIEEEHQEKERLLKIGYRDQLTGLVNRASGEREIIQSLARESRSKVLLFLDVDYFKNFNDRYGHSCGDAVLSTLGEALREVFSSEDVLCRWGGDEFILLIKGEGAQENNLHVSLQKLQKRMRKISYLGTSLSVTLSIGGIATSAEVSFQELFELADAALYEVKNEGRNHFRVVYSITDFDDLSRKEIE